MKIAVSIEISKSLEDIWKVVTNIDGSPQVISGIESVEIIEGISATMEGLKWKETRTLFGKTATEVMWVTGVEKKSYYTVEAESHGSKYYTDVRLTPNGSQTILTMEFEGVPQTLGAKCMWFFMGFMFKGATKKALRQDLEDIKRFAENSLE
ncbi:MAG: SRPBCC family protein [Fibrobacterales bacterium]